MHGVVSLLDPQSRRLVESIWVELENEFGLSSAYVPRIAHFSYQIAEEYNVKRLGAALEQLAQAQRPFHVRTSGLGLFTGSSPVLYIPIVRNPQLTQLHAAVCQAIDGAGTGQSDLYSPENWIPHITLAQGDLGKDNLPRLVRWLTDREFAWQIPVTNIGLIYHTGNEYRLKLRFAFQAGTRENNYPDYN
jgi:2'-5' RNA ligase